jgi:hypothetical protein
LAELGAFFNSPPLPLDLVYFFIHNFTDCFNLLKYITHTLFLRTTYVSFADLDSQVTARAEHSKLSNNILSYCIKPLTYLNFYDKPYFFDTFDTNTKRNSFYISKIKDISKPLLYFNFNDSKLLHTPSKNTTDQTQNNTSESNIQSLQKNISSFQIDKGPRIIIKQPNFDTGTNKTKIE